MMVWRNNTCSSPSNILCDIHQCPQQQLYVFKIWWSDKKIPAHRHLTFFVTSTSVPNNNYSGDLTSRTIFSSGLWDHKWSHKPDGTVQLVGSSGSWVVRLANQGIGYNDPTSRMIPLAGQYHPASGIMSKGWNTVLFYWISPWSH